MQPSCQEPVDGSAATAIGMLLKVCCRTLRAWTRVSPTCFSKSNSILILPSQAFSPGTSTNHTQQVHVSIQLCHHFHLCLISTLVSASSTTCHVSGLYKHIFTSSHPHPLYQPISRAHLPPSRSSHPSHRLMLSSPLPPLPPPHPTRSFLLSTTPHCQPLVIGHHHGIFILPNPRGFPICFPDHHTLFGAQCFHLLPKPPNNCLVQVSDIPSVLCVCRFEYSRYCSLSLLYFCFTFIKHYHVHCFTMNVPLVVPLSLMS